MRFALLSKKRRSALLAIESQVLDEIAQLRSRMPDLLGVLVASVDGMVIAQDVSKVEVDTFAAMSAAQLGLGQQLVALLASGDFRETVTYGTEGHIATFAVGTRALMAVIAGPELNLGLLHHEARPVAARVAALVPGFD